MAAGCVIGVDLGGTKLLAGAVDADLAVHHRAQRSLARTTTRRRCSTLLAEMVHEAREAAPGAGARRRLRHPGCLVDPATGVVARLPAPAARGRRRSQALMAERLGMPVAVDNDAQLRDARRVAPRRRARGATTP